MAFNLYKDRDFGAYISDTIEFFKKYWKNYFLNFITLSGGLLLIFSLIYYFIFKDFISQVLSNPYENPALFFDENMGISFALLAIGMLVAIIFGIVVTAYPIAYLRLVDKTGKDTFTASELLNEVKKDFIRVLVFGILSLFTIMLVILVFFVISGLLSIILIGIPLFIIGIGATITWIYQSLFVYLNERVGFFTAMKEGWNILFSKFWHIAGTSTAMIFIVSILTTIVSIVPYFIGLGQIFTTASQGGEPDVEGFMPWMIAFYVLNMVSNFLLYNLIYINQGMIYYSSLEDQEHVQALSEIDTIGMNE